MTSRKILTESVWQVLNESTQNYLQEWDTLYPLLEEYQQVMEAELSADQIQQIFAAAETYSISNGKHKNKLGKNIEAAKVIAGQLKVPFELAKKINDKINELGRSIQDTAPVQGIDQAFERSKRELYDKLGGRSSKIVQTIEKLGQIAKDHPGKTKFLVGVLTTAAAFATGPAGGAAAGFVLRAANDLLKGEKLSTAVGKSAKTAAIGAAIGAISDVVKDTLSVTPPTEEGGPSAVSSEVSSDDLAAGGEDTASAFADVPLEEYKMRQAQSIIDSGSISSRSNIPWSDEMKAKLASMIEIEGDYPNDFKSSFDGNIYRGNIVMTPDEEVAFRQFYRSLQPEPSMGMMDDRVSDWLNENVEGVAENNEIQAAQNAARQAQRQAKLDAMSPEERAAYDAEVASMGDW